MPASYRDSLEEAGADQVTGGAYGNLEAVRRVAGDAYDAAKCDLGVTVHKNHDGKLTLNESQSCQPNEIAAESTLGNGKRTFD